ncbi:MAG TPA: dephospho-CoA kinase [Sphingobacterium sp.]|nr:dephospho-CoA kinase [Sphingobacterium sp.]
MSIHVGITGGIGAGKSYVAKVFKEWGVPFYDADKEAKDLMVNNTEIKNALIQHFGSKVYTEKGLLNRGYLSEIVFQNPEKLKLLNSIVHPVVIKHGEDWARRQTKPYSLKEAALLFESGSYQKLDYTILVVAPKELRIKRVQERDKISREAVLQRMDKQMPDEEKRKLADFIINNDGQEPLLPQIEAIHQKMMSKNKNL